MRQTKATRTIEAKLDYQVMAIEGRQLHVLVGPNELPIWVPSDLTDWKDINGRLAQGLYFHGYPPGPAVVRMYLSPFIPGGILVLLVEVPA